MIPNEPDGGSSGVRGALRADGAHPDRALRERSVRALAGALPQPFWTSQPGAPAPAPALTGPLTADLAVVGGGFCRSPAPIVTPGGGTSGCARWTGLGWGSTPSAARSAARFFTASREAVARSFTGA